MPTTEKVSRRSANRHGLRNALLLLGAYAVWDANRRWSRRFLSASLGAAQVRDRDGRLHTGRRVEVHSLLDCPPDKAWQAVQTPVLLAHISAPLLGFKLRDGGALPEVWQAGETARLNLIGFAFLPLGQHDITVERIDGQKREIVSRESGLLAPVWNHTIRIEPAADGRTHYSDVVELAAGPLNPLVGNFAYLLYRYRQTRWQMLAPTL